MTKEKPNFKNLAAKAVAALKQVRRYSLVLFLAFVLLLYSFILLRINSLSNVQPSSDAVSGQVKAARIPHVDPLVIKQLQSLQDNSVSVQTLFNQARSNPFQ
jgi:hypothetical protein